MNVTFFPMHFVGLNGMPRRIYTYSANQGWELENLVESLGAYLLGFATLIFVYNLVVSRRRGPIAGNDPWGAPTIEWTLPSPPPDYNYAAIPNVTSRYPLWDMKSPHLTSEVPHGAESEKRTDVKIGGSDAGSFKAPSDPIGTAEKHDTLTEKPYPTANELGIAMPYPTIKPLIAALGITVMFTGLIWNKHLLVMLLGAAIFVASLYAWLLSPLEPEHHH